MLKLLIIILLLGGSASAQVIFDSTSAVPVGDVFIYTADSLKYTTSDGSGRFDASLFTPADTLVFSHLSYNKLLLAGSFLLSSDTIYLTPRALTQKAVLVTSNYSPSSSFKEEVKVEGYKKAGFVDVGYLTAATTSLYVKDYGGFGGAKVVSSRGLSSENTVVLFNEARVNDLRTGIFDLSSVGSAAIDKITYSKTSDDAGSTAAGGVVKISSGSLFEGRNISAGLRAGGGGYSSVYFNYKDGSPELYFTLSGERSYSANNYTYSFQGQRRERQNAHFNKTYIGGSGVLNKKDIYINLYAGWSFMNSGIPGFVVTNNFSSTRAQNKTGSFLTVLNGRLPLSEAAEFQSVISYNRQNLSITDPDGIIVFKEDAKTSKLNDITVRNSAAFNFDVVRFTAGYDFGYSDLNDITTFVSANNAPPVIKRITNKVYSSIGYDAAVPLNYISQIRFNLNSGLEFFNERLFTVSSGRIFNYGAGLTITPEIKGVSIKLNYGSTYRLPTFNERFYSSLFNHYDLNKENYNLFDAGVEFSNDDISGSAVFFYIDADNKIIWIPARLAVQTPRNIAAVTSQGAEFSYRHKIFDFLNTSVLYTYTDARNKTMITGSDNTYNKSLIYTPAHRINFNISAALEPFRLEVFNSYSSGSYYTADNNPLYKLEAYFLLDASLACSASFWGIKNSLTISAYNVLNEEYFVLQSYPMPLRTFLFTYSLEIK